MTGQRRARLAISFADLCLLLLGFFVLLQASGSRSAQVLSGVSEQFGGKVAERRAPTIVLPSGTLFASGEAMLTEAGKARISAIGARYARTSGTIELTSVGQDASARRFDAWDLAAARLGAVARTLTAAGVSEKRLVIRGLDEAGGGGKGQVIRIAAGPGSRSD